MVGDWQFPSEDLKIIKRDWQLINQKIIDGKAHELSEGDTFYLGVSTKSSKALKSYRKQPFNKEKAKQITYSLKQGYVNHIITKIANEKNAVYGKIIEHPDVLYTVQSIENFVISKFEHFYGKSVKKIEKELGLQLNRKAKNYFANLTNAIFGIKLEQKIEEFEKAGIKVKTVRLKENNLPKEDISFPTFKYKELLETDWEDSDFKNILESKFFFVFYQFEGDNLILRKVKFWNMPHSDIIEVKSVWDRLIETVSKGKIVKQVTCKGQRKTYFPKKKDNKISHVRPHARNASDTYILPVIDKLTGATKFTKHCFWLNASYIKHEIYSK